MRSLLSKYVLSAALALGIGTTSLKAQDAKPVPPTWEISAGIFSPAEKDLQDFYDSPLRVSAGVFAHPSPSLEVGGRLSYGGTTKNLEYQDFEGDYRYDTSVETKLSILEVDAGARYLIPLSSTKENSGHAYFGAGLTLMSTKQTWDTKTQKLEEKFPNVYVPVSAPTTDSDPVNLSALGFYFQGGVVIPVTPKFGIFGEVSGRSAEKKGDGGATADLGGFSIEAGIRGSF